jgi:4-amino-4-deoxy-L-arabinose transferase-like glycosyltransferase
LLTHFWRLGELTLRGEETRWAQSAREMLRTGDWVVPRQQGEPFLNRPPLGSWLMAVVTLIRGECDVLAIRLPTAIASLLTSSLVYCYARRFISVAGALTAGLAFATMGQVLELGRLAESDSVFTLLVSGSLLGWHLLYYRRGATPWTWVVGYGLAALATLAKGPQAPVYFVGPVVAYLLWRRDWRGLLCLGHAVGILAYLVILGSWQAQVLSDIGWLGVQQMWWADTALRFAQHTPWTIARHLLTYPLETLACTAPWSILLCGLVSRRLRGALSDRPQQALTFLLVCLAVTFPTCWLTPGARGRYFMPLYPCIAVLVGFVANGLARMEFRGWLAPVLGRRTLAHGLPAVAALLGLGYASVAVSTMVRTSEDAAGAVAALKERLPTGHRLVSFERVHHTFAYHYISPIELRPFPTALGDLADGHTYFCFDRYGRVGESLPFAWEEVAVVSCDRNRKTRPDTEVVVGRAIRSRAD